MNLRIRRKTKQQIINLKRSKMKKFEKLIKSTLINSTDELKEGDVLYIKETRQMKMDTERNSNWPECNFHRLTVVRAVNHFEDENIWRYDTVQHNRLTSTNGDHEIIYRLLKENELLTNGSFGANNIIDEHRETYRLDEITNHPMVVHDMPNLKGNPAYDLMM
jgi:hypothetical protein